MKLRVFMVIVAATLAAGCGQPQPAPETNAPPAGAAAEDGSSNGGSALARLSGETALTPGEGASEALTLSRTVEAAGTAEGQDPHVILRFAAADGRVLLAHEANHTPFDVTAQAAGGALATAIGAPAGVAPTFYRVESQEGAPLICPPQGPVSVALYEDGAGNLVVTGLTIASFEGTEGETGITIAALPADAVCGRAVYGLPAR